uniref:hypothetical protein n=1 Tax=Pedobacter schmidteae TaxID=2201271 RepID=UPI000EB252FA|nr:hypothetical protein [Pedobacter schmidteae]
MTEKVIVRSSTIDRHGDQTPLELMEKYVESVNGVLKMRYLANHRRDIPPIGYFDNGEIIKKEDIYHAVVEPISFTNRKPVDWDANFIIEDCNSSVSFIKRTEDNVQETRISLDKNNFNSFDSFNETGLNLHNLYRGSVILEANTRKAFLPDPQVVITLAKYYFIFYPLLKPILKRIGEKMADEISDYIYDNSKEVAKKLINNLVDTVKLIRKDTIPKNKTLLTIFEIPGDPYIELHIKSDDSSKIVKALTSNKLSKVHTQIRDLQENIDISEIYFVLNEKNKWQFSYLISKTGQILGTKSAFEKRDKLVNRINLSPTKAFSVGAEGVKYEKHKREET